MKKLTLGVVLALISASPILADHNNPWATEEDEVKSQYHDANQEKSEGTPGENEMKGRQVQNASPKAGQGSGNGKGGGKN